MSKFVFFNVTFSSGGYKELENTLSINERLRDPNIEDVQMSTVQTSYGYVVNFVLKIKEDE